MPSYKAPVEEISFLLNDVLEIGRFGNLPGYSDATPDVVDAVLRGAADLAEGALLKLNASGDREGCRREADGSVRTPAGFRGAWKDYTDGGWLGLAVDAAYGGQGLPYVLNMAVSEFLASANLAFSLYPGLTQGALAALLTHGSEEQKALYAPPLTAGRWTGTMNLTEPHAGTDLGLLKTRAEPLGEGTYAITGQKIFISAGEHDLAENVVHLVLARIVGAPAGTHGITLFIVPKLTVAADGSVGASNGVTCGSIEHKMGIHGNATCVMNYDRARGVILGEANKGLNAMFVMMNEARLVVGMQGLALSEVAYQNAALYAKERLQGRSISGVKFPDLPADPIIVHPDIRRALLEIRSFNEAARALFLWTALQSDVAHRSGDAKAIAAAQDHLGLMTPVIKGFFTDVGFDNTVKAQQIFGGHGYIAETGVEQFVRDARIAMIYEGANGIQALDLVGRKLPKDGGRAIMAFFAEIGGFLEANKDDVDLAPLVAALKQGLGRLQEATVWFMQNGVAKPDHAAAGSADYLHLLGLVALGFMWARIAKAALARRSADKDAAPTMQAKLITAKFFMERMLPQAGTHLARIKAGSDTMMAMPIEAF
ncbi:MAG TPA: acyl-CoA dehydrogenase C-terminal domain-containing protein [Beijerinckiaceae bacterium]|nr:acyl-CoA dehydrogenase C-terminal domain-containing protein [Beijerinckiaceae bacterium]